MRYLLFLLVFVVSLHSSGQDNYYFIPRGTHFSFGPYSAVPTNGVLFPNKYADDPTIVHQNMLSEWYTPGLGGFVDVAYNFSEFRPFQLGGSFRWQRLFNDLDKHTRTLNSQYYVPDVDWRYRRSVRYFNINLFADYSFWNYQNLYFFGRGEVGAGIYRMKNKFNWSMDFQDSTNNGPRIRETDFVFSGELATGVRWQFNHNSSLSLSVGYQVQSINDFVRRAYMSSLQGHLTDDHYYPQDEDFYETSNYGTPRPVRVKNEFLYLKLGLTHQITGEGFKRFMAEKPVLYLYPKDTTNVHVELALDEDHEIAYDYPKYDANAGWNVRVSPNGMMEHNDRNYYCLFWETEGPAIAKDLTKGFVVEKENAQAFLEEKLHQLGLNDKEANEFIIYWLPKMEQSPYNAVYFATEEYEAVSQLNITPTPDQIIRIMMLVEPLDAPIKLDEQVLPARPERKGFTAVEWGGSQGKFFEKEFVEW